MFRQYWCERFSLSQRNNFAVAPHRRRSALQSADPSENELFDWSGVLPSQFLHFCGTWEVGWPFCWEQQLRPVHRPCGLLECLDPDVEFNLIKDENLGGNEPDCETNQDRTERE